MPSDKSSTLSRLGKRFPDDEAPTKTKTFEALLRESSLSEADQYALRKVIRNWIAADMAGRRIIQAVAVYARPGIED